MRFNPIVASNYLYYRFYIFVDSVMTRRNCDGKGPPPPRLTMDGQPLNAVVERTVSSQAKVDAYNTDREVIMAINPKKASKKLLDDYLIKYELQKIAGEKNGYISKEVALFRLRRYFAIDATVAANTNANANDVEHNFKEAGMKG
jgi:hypothetical protein